MRLLHTADVHLGESTFGPPGARTADLAAMLDRFVQTAKDEKVDVAVFAGDTFTGRRPAPDLLRVFARTLAGLARHGIEVLVTPGNHDGMGTVADPDSHTLAWMAELDIDHVATFPTPFVGQVAGVTVSALPYPHKRAIASDRELDTVARTESAAKALTDVIEEMRDRAMRLPAPRLFIGHLSVVGARTASETAMRVGWDATVSPQVLEGFDYAALGHIHLSQPVGGNAFYAGAPERITFAEEAHEKSWLLVDVHDAGHQVRPIPSGARDMVTVDLELGDDWELGDAIDPTGAIVRLRIHGDPPSEALRNAHNALQGAWAVREVYLPTDAESAAHGVLTEDLSDADLLETYLRDVAPSTIDVWRDLDPKDQERLTPRVLTYARRIMEGQ